MRILILIILCLSINGQLAQECINATGGIASGSGGSVNYSIGQVTYHSHIQVNESVTEGVQQPYEISVVTAIEEAKHINLSISAYPNPTTDYLTLEVKEVKFLNFRIQLYNINGKLLQNEKNSSNHTSIDMRNLDSATYLMKIIQDNHELKTFKIIKN